MNETDHEPRARILVGLMAGTSGDGIAGAIIRTSGYGRDRTISVLGHRVVPYGDAVRAGLFGLFPPQRFDVAALGAVHHAVGVELAAVAARLIDDAGLDRRSVDAVAIQAPTILHQPPTETRPGVHIEVGDASVIAARLGIPVVCDLRPSDMAVGGQGAPLSAFVDFCLYSDSESSRAVQNIGGIANVTYLPRGGGLDDTLAFDTGPGNLLIDGVVQSLSNGRLGYDIDGAWAARGAVDDGLATRLLAHPYVQLPIPKTSGREDFGAEMVARILGWSAEARLPDADVVATVTQFTAACIATHYERELVPRGGVDEVILYGGGAFNKTLVDFVSKALSGTRIRSQAEFGIPVDARESVTWAVLADETLAGNPSNVPSASGAQRRVLLGRVVRLDDGATQP